MPLLPRVLTTLGVAAAGLGAAVAVPATTASMRGADAAAGPAAGGTPAPQPWDADATAAEAGIGRSFYFARAQYSGDGVFPNWKDWRTDFPKADRQFLVVLKRLARLDLHEWEHAVRLDDPSLRRFPFLYAVEVGHMRLSDDEVRGLRDYLQAGGFLVVDDFWGSREWRSFEAQMRRVFPEHAIVDIPMDHPIFHTYYDIEEVIQVPNVGQGIAGGPTFEADGVEPRVRGIFDERGRMMVAINWNTDLGDAWEWAEHPDYPLRYSTYAYQIGVNFIVYAMSH